MAAPARRVFALSISAHCRPIEYAFNAATDPRRSFGFLRPHRFEHLQHEAGVNSLRREVAEHRVDVRLSRVLPLPAMFSVPPVGPVRRDVGFAAAARATSRRTGPTG